MELGAYILLKAGVSPARAYNMDGRIARSAIGNMMTLLPHQASAKVADSAVLNQHAASFIEDRNREDNTGRAWVHSRIRRQKSLGGFQWWYKSVNQYEGSEVLRKGADRWAASRYSEPLTEQIWKLSMTSMTVEETNNPVIVVMIPFNYRNWKLQRIMNWW